MKKEDQNLLLREVIHQDQEERQKCPNIKMTMWLICKIICLLKIVCLFLQGTSSIPFWSVVRVMDGKYTLETWKITLRHWKVHSKQWKMTFGRVTSLAILPYFDWPKWPKMAIWPHRSICSVWKWSQWISHAPKPRDRHKYLSCSESYKFGHATLIWLAEMDMEGGYHWPVTTEGGHLAT